MNGYSNPSLRRACPWEMKVWVTPPGKPSKPAEVVTKGEGGLEWRRERMGIPRSFEAAYSDNGYSSSY